MYNMIAKIWDRIIVMSLAALEANKNYNATQTS